VRKRYIGSWVARSSRQTDLELRNCCRGLRAVLGGRLQARIRAKATGSARSVRRPAAEGNNLCSLD